MGMHVNVDIIEGSIEPRIVLESVTQNERDENDSNNAVILISF